MKKQQYIGVVLLIIGILLLSFGDRLLTLIDFTPPEWLIASDGDVGITPRDGAVYQKIDMVQVGVKDLESGVASVIAVVDGISYSLELYLGDAYQGCWYVGFSPLSVGNHVMQVVATNYANLSISYSATFTVYDGLQGEWYINDQKITTSTIILSFDNNSLTFKFIRTIEVSDLLITCTVEWSGTSNGVLSLERISSGTWAKTYNFTKGVYTITLEASDGTHTIEYTIFQVYIQTAPPFTITLLQLLGIASTITGLVLIVVPGRKETITY